MASTTPPPAPLDPLFVQPAVLDAQRHRDLTYNPQCGYAFAARLIAVPISYAEFHLAARDYPIVFAGPQATPLALLGLRNGTNLLVDSSGNWRAGRYIPAHLQRYPFLFLEDRKSGQFVLGIDESAEHFRPAEGGEPLFAAGNASALVERAADFLSGFHSDLQTTQLFTQGLLDAGLLVERHADIRLPSGEQISVDTFRIVDEAAFNALPGDTIAAWHKKSWLPLVYFHLQSLANWNHLLDWSSN